MLYKRVGCLVLNLSTLEDIFMIKWFVEKRTSQNWNACKSMEVEW